MLCQHTVQYHDTQAGNVQPTQTNLIFPPSFYEGSLIFTWAWFSSCFEIAFVVIPQNVICLWTFIFISPCASGRHWLRGPHGFSILPKASMQHPSGWLPRVLAVAIKIAALRRVCSPSLFWSSRYIFPQKKQCYLKVVVGTDPALIVTLFQNWFSKGRITSEPTNQWGKERYRHVEKVPINFLPFHLDFHNLFQVHMISCILLIKIMCSIKILKVFNKFSIPSQLLFTLHLLRSDPRSLDLRNFGTQHTLNPLAFFLYWSSCFLLSGRGVVGSSVSSHFASASGEGDFSQGDLATSCPSETNKTLSTTNF